MTFSSSLDVKEGKWKLWVHPSSTERQWTPGSWTGMMVPATSVMCAWHDLGWLLRGMVKGRRICSLSVSWGFNIQSSSLIKFFYSHVITGEFRFLRSKAQKWKTFCCEWFFTLRGEMYDTFSLHLSWLTLISSTLHTSTDFLLLLYYSSFFKNLYLKAPLYHSLNWYYI